MKKLERAVVLHYDRGESADSVVWDIVKTLGKFKSPIAVLVRDDADSIVAVIGERPIPEKEAQTIYDKWMGS